MFVVREKGEMQNGEALRAHHTDTSVMAQVDQTMRAYYAQRAPYYDAVYDKPERVSELQFLKSFLPQKFTGRNLLEVACGTGY
jgi:ubiquinone/menaquinone biosynthesis C-methylase UbiE